MVVFEYLTSAPSGGNPVYISDLTKFASLIQTLAKVTTRHNSYNTSTSSIVKDIAILSGFDTVGNNQVTPGYIYYKGDIYGFRSDNNLTLGGYLIATKTNTTLRTTKEGTDFYAYTSCELSVSASAGASGTTVGAFTAANIAIWKTFTPTSIGITIPNEFITTPMLGREIIRAANIASGTIQLKNMANNSIGTDQIIDGAVTSDKIAGSAVTTDELAENAVSTNNIADGSVILSKLGSDVISEIRDAKLSFGQYTFLSGKLTVYKESHSNIWHIKYSNPTAVAPTNNASMLLGSIAGPGASEFLAMIQRNYPQGYMSSIFTSASNYLFKVQIGSDGIAKALFHFAKPPITTNDPGIEMHDTIIEV